MELMDAAGTAAAAAYNRSDVVEALHEHQPALVAVGAGGELVGAAVARISGPDAHLLVFAIHPTWRHLGIGSALLRRLDQEIIHRGAEPSGGPGPPGPGGGGGLRQPGVHPPRRAAPLHPRLVDGPRGPGPGGALRRRAPRGRALGGDEGVHRHQGALGTPGPRTPAAPRTGRARSGSSRRAPSCCSGRPGPARPRSPGPSPPDCRGASSSYTPRCSGTAPRGPWPCARPSRSSGGWSGWSASSTRPTRSPPTGPGAPTPSPWSTSS